MKILIMFVLLLGQQSYSFASDTFFGQTKNKRGIASAVDIDNCYDSTLTGQKDVNCKNFLKIENNYVTQTVNKLIEKENSEADFDYSEIESAAIDYKLDQRKYSKGLFANIKNALKDFKAYKKENASNFREAKKDLKRIQKEIKSNEKLSEKIADSLKKCKNSSSANEHSVCVKNLEKVISDATGVKTSKLSYFIPQAHAQTQFSRIFTGCKMAYMDNDDPGAHILLFGYNSMTCSNGGIDEFYLDTRVYGPGLSITGIEVLGMVCTGNVEDKVQVGLAAQASGIMGFGTGFTVGGAGLCLEISMTLAAGGAYAGLVTRKFW